MFTFSTAQDSVSRLTNFLALGISHATSPGELAQLPEPALLTDAPSTRTVAVTWQWRAEGPSFKRRQNMEQGHEKTRQIQRKKKHSQTATGEQKDGKTHINTESWQCRHGTLTLIGSTRRQRCRKMRETQQVYCISLGDMKRTVITGRVLSLINLQHFRERERERWKTKNGIDRKTHTHESNI